MAKRKQKRQRGAQPGNQNARKHGFYSKVLTSEQMTGFPRMAAVRNIDHEITALRTKTCPERSRRISAIMSHTPDNYDLLLRALSLLNRMLKTRDQLSERDIKALQNYCRQYSPDVESIISPN